MLYVCIYVCRLLYYNSANQAVKIGNVYKNKTDAINVWPFAVSAPTVPPCLDSNLYSTDNDSSNGSSSISCNNRRVGSERKNSVAMVASDAMANANLYPALGDLRPRFALPPGILTCKCFATLDLCMYMYIFCVYI